MRRFVISAVFVLPFSLSAQGLPPVAAVARVADSLAQAFIAERAAPGVAIALVREGTGAHATKLGCDLLSRPRLRRRPAASADRWQHFADLRSSAI